VFRRSATRRVVVSRPAGLHARPCLAIATTVRKFQSQVTLRCKSGTADASQVLELMSLAATQGTEVHFTAKGPDAEGVLDALVELFDTDFGLSDAPGA